MEIPQWLTKESIMMAVVLVLAMGMHYHFIMERFHRANEEALDVLKNMPELQE